MLANILEYSPQLSELKADHCEYEPYKDFAQPLPPDRTNISLAITTLELDLIGMDAVLCPLVDSAFVNFEFCKPLKKLTLNNHLERISPARPPYLWKETKVCHNSWMVKRMLSKMHGVEQLYLRTGVARFPGACPQSRFIFKPTIWRRSRT